MLPTHLPRLLFLVSVGVIPLYTYGQSFEYPESLLVQTLRILNSLFPIVVSIATIFFLWGCVEFIRAQKDEGRAEGRKKVMWGVIALFVLVSTWGIVALLQEVFLGKETYGAVDWGMSDFFDDWGDGDDDDDGGGGDDDNDGGGGDDDNDGCRPGWNDMTDPCPENPLI